MGDRIITSLFLVANVREVVIHFHGGNQSIAFVTRKDVRRNLAELLPSERAVSPAARFTPLAASPDPDVKPIEELEWGSPLLIVDASANTPRANVGRALYGTRVAERFEELWHIKPNAPLGFIGSGVWNIEGEFVGFALGEKIPFTAGASFKRRYPRVYGLPGEEVMEFAEFRA